MAIHFIGCEDCGNHYRYERLRENGWRCLHCDATLDIPPSEKQLHFAENLGIEGADKMSGSELSAAISKAKAMRDEEDSQKQEEALRIAHEEQRIRDGNKHLDEATPDELLQELSRRNMDFVIVHGERGCKADDMRLVGTFDSEKLVGQPHYLSAIFVQKDLNQYAEHLRHGTHEMF